MYCRSTTNLYYIETTCDDRMLLLLTFAAVTMSALSQLVQIQYISAPAATAKQNAVFRYHHHYVTSVVIIDTACALALSTSHVQYFQ